MLHTPTLYSEAFGRAFARPGSAADEPRHRLQQGYLWNVAQRVDRAAEAAGRSVPDLIGDDLLAQAKMVASGSDIWRPELGITLEQIRQHSAAAPIQFLLALQAIRPISGAWRAPLDRPVDLLFAGVLITAESEVHIEASETQLNLITGSGRTRRTTFDRIGRVWRIASTRSDTQSEAGLIEAGDIQIHLSPFLLAAEESHALPLPSVSRASSLADIAFQVDQLTEAARCVDASTAGYGRWVGDVVKLVLILDPARDVGDPVFSSCSWPARPGLITMGFSRQSQEPWEPVHRISDSLVHEASHQYANMLSLICRFVDGDDGELHYSILARKSRPLDRVLFAFHAAANMALFYADAISRGREDCRYNFEWSLRAAASLREPLDASKTLTDVGRGLYLGLAEGLDGIDRELIRNA